MELSKYTGPQRATRFAVAVPIQYRRLGEKEWHTGVAENISATGVLFRGDRALSEQEVIELNFTLRAPQGPEPQKPTTGIVVRRDRSRLANKPAFGTRFLD